MIADDDTLYAGLDALLTRLSGVDVAATERDVSYVFPSAGSTGTQGFKIEYRFTTVGQIGRHEVRRRYDPDAEIEGDTYEPNPDVPEERLGGLIYSVHGNTRHVLEIELFAPVAGRNARVPLEAIRNKLRLPSALAEINALGLALSRVGEIQDTSGLDETGHASSSYVLEVFLNSAFDAEDDPVTTIEQHEITYPA